MAKPKDDDKTPEIDEHYLRELIDFGFGEMDVFMRQHLAFDEFYERRERGTQTEETE